MVRLYRFYNYEAGKDGEPFALCDDCRKEQPVPEFTVLNLIAHVALAPCKKCAAENSRNLVIEASMLRD